ncbi:MAG: hypothetical protein ACLFV3_01745 [Phycisphaeraceae bacterium]
MASAMTMDGLTGGAQFSWRQLLGLWLARREADEGDQPEEEGRSESQAASSSSSGAARPTPAKGDDTGDAPESGTREANE